MGFIVIKLVFLPLIFTSLTVLMVASKRRLNVGYYNEKQMFTKFLKFGKPNTFKNYQTKKYFVKIF